MGLTRVLTNRYNLAMGLGTPENKQRNDDLVKDYELVKQGKKQMWELESKYKISRKRIYDILHSRDILVKQPRKRKVKRVVSVT